MSTRRAPAWHSAAVIAFTAVCAWFVFHVHERPPGLTYMDIAVHEAGHVAFAPFGVMVMLAMGDGAQILFPLGLAAFQLGRRRDLVTGATLLAWAGEACGDAANYIGDAPFSRFSLIGGNQGDWTRFFGSEHLNRMDLAAPVSTAVRVAAVLLMLAAVAISVYGLWTRTRVADERRASVEAKLRVIAEPEPTAAPSPRSPLRHRAARPSPSVAPTPAARASGARRTARAR